MKLLAVINEAKEMAMEGCGAEYIAWSLDLHIAAAIRIVDECEAHKAKHKRVMEAS